MLFTHEDLMAENMNKCTTTVVTAADQTPISENQSSSNSKTTAAAAVPQQASASAMFGAFRSFALGVSSKIASTVQEVKRDFDAQQQQFKQQKAEEGWATPTKSYISSTEASAAGLDPTIDVLPPSSIGILEEDTFEAMMEPGNSTAPSPPHPAPASHRSSISSSFNNVVVLISNSKTLVNNMAPISDSLKTLTSNLIQTTSKAVHELSTSQSITLNPTNNNQATFNPDHLPWSHIKDDDIEQQEIKTQILGLAGDQRNFLVAPPPTSDFTFTPDDEHWTQQAVALLSVDSNLQKMRYALVPKSVKEDLFWRNYFYRVSMIIQAAKLKVAMSATSVKGPSSSSSTTSQIPPLASPTASPSISTSTATHVVIVGDDAPPLTDVLFNAPEEEDPENLSTNVVNWEEELAKELEDL